MSKLKTRRRRAVYFRQCLSCGYVEKMTRTDWIIAFDSQCPRCGDVFERRVGDTLPPPVTETRGVKKLGIDFSRSVLVGARIF